MSDRLFTFSGGSASGWRVRSQLPYIGRPLAPVSFINVINGNAPTPDPAHGAAFEELLVELRASEEWKYVDREVDIRLVNSEA